MPPAKLLPPPNPRKAFTLIELLVVIAIIAILSVVVILTLNPAQLLQQSRDSNRISDMSTLNTALGIYLAQGGSSLGSSSVVYVSIPDPSATTTAGDQCQGLGLISLPSTYSYHCAASSTFRDVNGQGWIPVNFTSLPAGSPLGSLPTDPTNTSSSREYYTYDTNGSQYEVTMVPESQKYQLGGSNDVIANDGGTLASVYEKGNAYGLEPLDYGDPTLVGWWPLTEGTGTIAYDGSGNNATGSWSGTQAGTNGYYSPGKIGSWAGAFASTARVTIPDSTSLNLNNVITISFWIQWNGAISNYADEFAKSNSGVSGYAIQTEATTTAVYMRVDTSGGINQSAGLVPNALDGNWHNVVFVLNNGVRIGYEDGTLAFSNTYNAGTGFSATGQPLIFSNNSGFSGLIDDVRIYNRALSATQIAAMYAGGK